MSDTISFARGAPCPEALSGDLIAECTAAALARDHVRILSYGTGQGYPPLREWLAAEHGVPADRVFVTNGSLQGFVFLLDALLSPGDVIALEAPTYDRALLQARLHDLDILTVPMEADGLAVDALAASCAAGRVPRLLYTIPNFHNPAGTTISLEKRRALVDLAERYGFVIVEDDPYGKLRFEGDALPSLFELGGPERVIFTSSFSKTVAPGLRVGYLVASSEVSAKLAGAAGRTYISPALLAEAAVHHLCASGGLPANIAKVTGLMRERRDAMAAGLVHMPEGTACTPPGGGFFMWLELPAGLSADALEGPAKEAGVLYVCGSTCFLEGGERTLRLAYSGVGPAEIAEGMKRLGAVFSSAATA